MTKLVPLSGGKRNEFAIVDDEDYERVMQHRWTLLRTNNVVRAWINRRVVPLANFILSVPPGNIVDHKDHDRRNNQRNNLRPATYSQNNANSIRTGRSKSGFIGVVKMRGNRSSPYVARVYRNGKNIHLGYFNTAKEAAIARDNAARIYYGEFAVLNFPDEE